MTLVKVLFGILKPFVLSDPRRSRKRATSATLGPSRSFFEDLTHPYMNIMNGKPRISIEYDTLNPFLGKEAHFLPYEHTLPYCSSIQFE